METKTESKTASPGESHAIGTINWMPVVFALWKIMPRTRGFIRVLVHILKSYLPRKILTKLNVLSSCGAYGGQTAKTMFDMRLQPDQRHWHVAQRGPYYVVLGIQQTGVERLRRIEFKDEASGYTGRFPGTIRLTDANDAEIMDWTPVPWPESVYAVAPNNWRRTDEEPFAVCGIDVPLHAAVDLSSVRVEIRLVFPRGRDPMGSRYAYNANKLSLSGIKIWGDQGAVY